MKRYVISNKDKRAQRKLERSKSDHHTYYWKLGQIRLAKERPQLLPWVYMDELFTIITLHNSLYKG